MILALLMQVLMINHHVGDMGVVYHYCNESRLHVSGQNEERCGILQDSTHTEFLCSARNSLTNNTCWVEDKRE